MIPAQNTMMELPVATATCLLTDGNLRTIPCMSQCAFSTLTLLTLLRDEHRRRAEDCYFFTLTDSYAATRKPRQKKKGRFSRASKASRLSTQSNLTAFSEAPSLMSLGDAPAEVDDSILTTATTATTATTTSVAGKGRKGRPKATAKGTRKTTRTKKATAASESMIVDDSIAPAVIDLDVEEEAPQPPPKRQTRGKAKQSDALQSDNRSVLETSSPPQRATRTRNTKAKTKARLSDDESQLQSELVDAVTKASDHASEQGTPKARRGTKRTSDGMARVESSVVILEDLPEPVQEIASKAKRGRKPMKRAEEALQPRSSEIIESSEVVPEPKAKAAPKARKGRKVNKKEEPIVVEPSLDDFPVPPPSIRREPSPLQSTVPPSSIRGDITPHQSTPKPPSDEPSPAQPSPTPIRSARGPIQPSPATVVRPRTAPPTKESTPPASPQSSDVENQPPSSRPASSRPPLSARHANFIPLASTALNVSPSKRGQSNTITGGLVSSMPWQPVDLETIFLPSPSSAPLQQQLFDMTSNSPADTALDKENIPQGLSVAEAVKRVKEGLTSPEKKMNVEEWIYFNARRGEEKLRSECERLVGAFEAEGGKALLTLEGIESVQ